MGVGGELCLWQLEQQLHSEGQQQRKLQRQEQLQQKEARLLRRPQQQQGREIWGQEQLQKVQRAEVKGNLLGLGLKGQVHLLIF
jgi:hypothetical protein